MGEAKRRGTQAQRVSQAQARLDALRPEKLVCGACQTAFTTFDGMEPRNLPGIHAIFGGECPNCGESVISFSGEPEAVANAMLLYQQTMENAKLGAQNQEGEHTPYVDTDDGKPQS
ncbi:hypothetical protein [Ralstonia solanacearum]|uniref:Uncharacterized protein n=1 Tax=Ralstonia solanacearum TaxID=305 RepID=A0A177RQ63_RALSL|nr:hypothetical protein [Ralstonia solanacearum]AST32040.1 hypothetical protein CDC46_07655 [Ralstonia solanacearum]ATJ86492.1 hypothetical protein CDC59_09610 [Ralstonia solanacearum]KFX26893.1 hypothetical protein KR96_21050 [Ralstonia solanacearum]MBB6582239.1 hypothetical protein [Ralstonia solanacearum]MDB0509384.1 hypothetical protein [Ralstonia solanacearum]